MATMARKSTALAGLDIVGEGLAQQDGLAERLSRQRATRASQDQRDKPDLPGASSDPAMSKDHNAWRRGKALLQVAIPDESHIELAILAKRRRMTLSQLVKVSLNQWLENHGHALRLPE